MPFIPFLPFMHGCFLSSHFDAVQLFFQVGGIKDKVLAAHRAGMKRVILPKRNEKDLKEVDDNVKVREGRGVGMGHREREKGARVVGEGNEGSDFTKTKRKRLERT